MAARRLVLLAAGIWLGVSAGPGMWWPRARANERLRAIPANTALDLGAYRCEDFPELIDTEQTPGCGTITDYSGMVYDPVGHRMLVWGGGHAATYRDDVEALDLETLEWYVDAPPTPCEDMVIENVDLSLSRWITTNHPIARHSYDLLVVVPDEPALWMLAKIQGRGRGCNHLPPVSDEAPYVLSDGSGGAVARYDLVARQWTFYPDVTAWSFGAGAEYDPVSGKILLVGGHGMSVLDPQAGVVAARVEWPDESLRRKIDTGEGVKLLYVPPRDSFYVVVAAPRTEEAGGVFEVTVDRWDWTRSSIRTIPTPLPDPPPDSQAWAFDESAGLIVGGVRDGVVYAFDPETEQWAWQQAEVDSDEGAAVGSVAALALAYDPVDAVIIFRTDHHSGRRTWAYRWGDAPVNFPDAGPGIPDAAAADGMPETDAALMPDAACPCDCGVDRDAGSGSGCGCRSHSPTGSGIWLIVAVAFALLRRLRDKVR